MMDSKHRGIGLRLSQIALAVIRLRHYLKTRRLYSPSALCGIRDGSSSAR